MKRCSVCSEVKPLEAFRVDLRRSYGRTSSCRDCSNRRQREKYRDDPGPFQRRTEKWRRDHPERHAEVARRMVAWRKAKDRDRRLSPVEQRVCTKVKNEMRVKAWKAANPERWALLQRMGQHRRYARKTGAAGTASPDQMQARWDYYGGLCWMCSAPAVEYDHVMPLSRGGTNWASNLRPACRSCNVRKGARPVATSYSA